MGERCNKGERGEGERWAQGLARFERRVEAPVLVLTRDDGAGPEARGAERGGGAWSAMATFCAWRMTSSRLTLSRRDPVFEASGAMAAVAMSRLPLLP